MTITASAIHLFFLLHFLTSSAQNHIHRPQSVEYAGQGIVQRQSVSATRPISPTKPVADQLNRADLYHRVAARSLGEGSSAIAEIACTVKNRLRVSGSPLHVVLRAYFAHDRPPQPEHIEIVRKVFEGELPCPETWWYALSPQDTRHFRPHRRPAVMIKRDPRDQIWIYDR